VASIGEVTTALRQVVDELPFAPLALALDLVEDAKALIELAAHGSGQDEFLQVIEWFDKTVEGIGELQQLLTAIQQSAMAATSRLEGQGTPTALVPQTNRPRTNPAGAGPQTAKPPPLTRATPDELLAKLPVRTKTNPKTRGVWQDDHGNEQDEIVSGRDELSGRAADELRRLGISPSRGTLTTTDHVEVKLAVVVRSTGQQAVTLAVNNQPCDDGRWSCDRLLPRILRPGQRLTVYWPGGVTTYHGRTP
jgi:hypothetical protein